MRVPFTVAMLVVCAACSSDSDPAAAVAQARMAPPAAAGHRAAAAELTRIYAASKLAQWDVRASVAGTDCDVLLVETPVLMEETMVAAMHYGAGSYEVYHHGVEQFYRDRAFRGVAYKDGSGKIWPYAIQESETLTPCR